MVRRLGIEERMRRNVKKQPQHVPWIDESLRNFKTLAILIVVVLCFSLLIYGIIRLKQSHRERFPKEFEGLIVEKSVETKDR